MACGTSSEFGCDVHHMVLHVQNQIIILAVLVELYNLATNSSKVAK